jgi:hypothetical protein
LNKYQKNYCKCLEIKCLLLKFNNPIPTPTPTFNLKIIKNKMGLIIYSTLNLLN